MLGVRGGNPGRISPVPFCFIYSPRPRGKIFPVPRLGFHIIINFIICLIIPPQLCMRRPKGVLLSQTGWTSLCGWSFQSGEGEVPPDIPVGFSGGEIWTTSLPGCGYLGFGSSLPPFSPSDRNRPVLRPILVARLPSGFCRLSSLVRFLSLLSPGSWTSVEMSPSGLSLPLFSSFARRVPLSGWPSGPSPSHEERRSSGELLLMRARVALVHMTDPSSGGPWFLGVASRWWTAPRW